MRLTANRRLKILLAGVGVLLVAAIVGGVRRGLAADRHPELIAVVASLVGMADASVRWGAEQRPGLGDRRRGRSGEHWAIRSRLRGRSASLRAKTRFFDVWDALASARPGGSDSGHTRADSRFPHESGSAA